MRNTADADIVNVLSTHGVRPEHPSPLPYVASDRGLAHASRWYA